MEWVSKIKNWLSLYFQGMMMGIADLIPGVSGGTVAFILGLHPDFLKSLKSIRLSALRHPKQIAWFVLTAIGFGMVTSIALGSHAIYFLLNHNIYQCLFRSLFMGLVIGSIFFCIRQIAQWNIARFLALTVGIVTAFSISHFCTRYSTEPLYDVPLEIKAPESVLHGASNYDHQNKLLKNVKWSNLKALYEDDFIDYNTMIFSHDNNSFQQVDSCLEQKHHVAYHGKLALCGALSIGAMILPGISGNQVMQLMGCYDPIIEAIAIWTGGVFKGELFNPSFWMLLWFGIGILSGIATFSRVLIYFYRRYFTTTLSALVGFMIGSLPNLWPFWSVTYHIQLLKDRYRLALQRVNPELPALTSYQTGLALAMLLIGVALIVFIERRVALKKLTFTEV